MNKLYHVLVTYATRRLLMLFLFLVTVGGMFMPYGAGSGYNGTGSSDMKPVSFSLLLLLFPIAGLNSYLGAFLKQQMATYRAALIPGYRRPHLIAAALVVLFPLAVLILAAAVSSLPLPGIIGLVTFAAMAGLYGGNGSQLVAFPCNGFLMATFFFPHLQAAVFEMLNGQQPGMAWSLISTALAGTALLFHRLATLTEDDPDFGKVMPMDPWDLRASAVRTQTRAVMQRSSGINLLMTGPASRRLDRITTRPATTLWQRVALLRLSDDAPSNVMSYYAASVMAIVCIFRLTPAMSMGDSQPYLREVLMFAALASITQFNLTYSRWPRLGYESLRPMTRQRWVIENALANAFNIAFLQLIVIGVNPLIIVPLLKSNLSLPWFLTASLIFLSSQILLFGLFSWVESFKSMSLNVIIAAGGGAAAISLTTEVLKSTSGHPDILMTLILSGIATVTGIAFCWMAYRRWCRIDLA